MGRTHMTKQKVPAKELIMEAAIGLFHTNGYNGTSIRDIARKANVNSANISYYFLGKQGLLESCIVHFFEGYLACLEKTIDKIEKDPYECLRTIVYQVIKYQSEHHLLARFAWREVSLDTQMVREIIASYLRKEKFLLKKVLEEGIRRNIFVSHSTSYIVIQLRGMLTMPFLHSQHLLELWNIYPHEAHFVNKYVSVINQWIENVLIEPLK